MRGRGNGDPWRSITVVRQLARMPPAVLPNSVSRFSANVSWLSPGELATTDLPTPRPILRIMSAEGRLNRTLEQHLAAPSVPSYGRAATSAANERSSLYQTGTMRAMAPAPSGCRDGWRRYVAAVAWVSQSERHRPPQSSALDWEGASRSCWWNRSGTMRSGQLSGHPDLVLLEYPRGGKSDSAVVARLSRTRRKRRFQPIAAQSVQPIALTAALARRKRANRGRRAFMVVRRQGSPQPHRSPSVESAR